MNNYSSLIRMREIQIKNDTVMHCCKCNSNWLLSSEHLLVNHRITTIQNGYCPPIFFSVSSSLHELAIVPHNSIFPCTKGSFHSFCLHSEETTDCNFIARSKKFSTRFILKLMLQLNSILRRLRGFPSVFSRYAYHTH